RGPIGAGGALLAGLATALASLALAPDGLERAMARSHMQLPLALAAGVAVALLVRYERRGRSSLLSRTALAEPAVHAGLAAGACVGGILYGCTAYVPLWIITHGRGNGLMAGAMLVPLLVGWAMGSGFSVRMLVAHGMRAVTVAGFGVAFVGAAGLALVVAEAAPTTLALASLWLLGGGLGAVAISSVLAPQSVVGWSDRGAVTSAVFAARMLGGSLAVAALGAIGREGQEAARFVGIAAVALTGAALSAALGPRGELRRACGDAVEAAAE
ncbi:MAG: hypothetical protein M3O50_12590, partial [Myxococcota bacterium]|nr:hypothetical protein [Myxococcota bacterium]